MSTLTVFNHISIDGYFVDANNDMSFANNARKDPEWDDFVKGNVSSGGGMMVFGRVTYDLMAGYWPTPAAAASMPEVAATMNNATKVVFSRTMDKAAWKNTSLFKGNLVGEIQELKKGKGSDMIIFGSGSIVSQLTEAGLIDEYHFIIDPVVLGKGRTMFAGVNNRFSLVLTSSRSFGNGNVLMKYHRRD